MENIQLIKITKDEKTIELLYTFLKNRKGPISHQSLPAFSEHRAFVYAHPYRAWYLIKTENHYIGTVYLLSNNSIGVHLESGYEDTLSDLLRLIQKKHQPLKAIKSVRGDFFSINVAPNHHQLINSLTSSGAIHIQSTYSIETI